MYMLKLHHQDDKIHARSIGPYSLVTQQLGERRSSVDSASVRWKFGRLKPMARPTTFRSS